jgi:hypothetical protein
VAVKRRNFQIIKINNKFIKNNNLSNKVNLNPEILKNKQKSSFIMTKKIMDKPKEMRTMKDKSATLKVIKKI